MQILYSQGVAGKQTGFNEVSPSAGEFGDPLVTQFQPAYYEWAYRGKIWTLNNGYAGTTLIVTASVIGAANWNPAIALYNPTGSGVNLAILSGTVTLVSGTLTAGGVFWAYGNNQTVTAAGGNGAVNVLTLVTGGSIAKTFIQSAMTGAAASGTAVLEPFPTSAYAGAALAATTSGLSATQDIGGRFICPPGGIIGIGGTLGTSTIVQAGLTWAEIPV
jgi:hypothetical protein